MNLIIDFYKNLDTFNLILFWGVIIVILLLLIFSFILINKNRKLKAIINKKGININDFDLEDDDTLAIKRVDTEQTRPKEDKIKVISHDTEIPVKQEEFPVKQENMPLDFEEIPINIKEENKSIEPIVNEIPKQEEFKEEKKFVAEEYVMEDNRSKKIEENINKNIPTEVIRETPSTEINTAQNSNIYSQNIKRETRISQTSPIGIIREPEPEKREINKSRDISSILPPPRKETPSNYKEDLERELKKVEITKPKSNYLEELNNKLKEDNGIKRTNYEIEQEENAIISYKELMEKKDSIQTIDEEDAIISIEELVAREKEKLYQITPEEGNEEFVNELKKFRNDL